MGTGEYEARGKYDALLETLQDFGSVCIGYSGGVDSAFLARAAIDAIGADGVLAVTGLSPAVPEVQRRTARAIAVEHGIPHLEVDTHELGDVNYAANPSNRCYFCKTELWRVLGAVARERGLAVIADGSNADDARDHRPGRRAAREVGVRSPLREVGLTKAEIRAHSKALGLGTWDQPSSPCLSSRLPYGLAVTPQRLGQVERAEDAVRALGLREFRVRHHGDAARLEVAQAELQAALVRGEALNHAVRAAGFARVLLDVNGYRQGALNEALTTVPLTMGRSQ